MTELLHIECRACGIERPLDDYRLYNVRPKQYMDFCVHCEKREGTLTLYRRYNAYGTKEIIEAVFAAERTPVNKRTEAHVRLLVQPLQVKAPQNNTEIIQQELARRELAKRRLIFFTTAFHPDYKPGWVHQDVCRRLERFVEAVERGESPRLMIALPPRAGKSALASDIFPSWVLGRHPEWGIIGASYAQSLPVGFSRNIRDRLRDDEYQAMFPDTKLRTDSQGIEEWRTTKGGGYIAAGVGVGITGKGMHIGIGDDLLKDYEAASSETIRTSATNWYQSVFRTRLAPGGGILLIGTRWHDMDVQGYVLEKDVELRKQGVPEDEMEGWEVITYPAIAEDDEFLLSNGQLWRGALPEGETGERLLRAKGEALHPERYSLSELKKIKHTFTTTMWSALYQQNPTPDDGEFFKRADFRHRVLPQGMWKSARIFITADYAIKKKQKNDYTVIAVFALDSNDDLYLLDLVRGRMGTFEIASAIVGLVEKYKPEVYAGEQGQIHEAVWPVAQKMLTEKRLSVSVDNSLTPITDKEARARPLQARTQLHKFLFSHYSGARPDTYDETEREMLRFPNGTHDDIVDALAWGARLSLNLSLPTQPHAKKQKSWRDGLTTAEDGCSHMAS